MAGWLRASADFLLSEWIWSVTWGVYVVPISIVIMFFLLKWVEQCNAIRSLLITLGAHLFSVILFSAFVVGVLIFLVRLEYIPPEEGYYHQNCNFLNVALYLGLIYASLQSLFFLLMSKKLSIHFLRAAVLAGVSNSLAALIVYLLLSKVY